MKYVISIFVWMLTMLVAALIVYMFSDNLTANQSITVAMGAYMVWRVLVVGHTIEEAVLDTED